MLDLNCCLIDLINSITDTFENEEKEKLVLENFLKELVVNKVNKQDVLNYLAKLFLNEKFTNLVALNCSYILSDLISRLKNQNQVQLFYILSKHIFIYPVVSEFVFSNYNFNFDPFSLSENSFLKAKRLKTENNDEKIIKILVGCLNYFYFNSECFTTSWNWFHLYKLIKSEIPEVLFLSYQCFRIIFEIPDNLFFKILEKKIEKNVLLNLRLKYFSIFEEKKISFPIQFSKDKNTKPCIVNNEDLNNKIVSVSGILLNKFEQNENLKQNNKYVLFNSFNKNLQNLALAVQLDEPVLIEGPVGCGKTSLIECLANFLGRNKEPEIIKLQMGDQIDRKVLIGSYHCTEIPGQFIWKAGPFTKALIDGNWIILEDIDLAPNDLITDIITILKTKTLNSISGCSFINGKVNSSFRIFFTRRIVEGYSESYRSTDLEVIYKMCEKISFNLIERSEMIELIKTKWPGLGVFSSRLIDIYDIVQQNQLISKTKRKITLRDLIKLCNRISETFDNKSKEAFTLLLDIYDCFINYINGKEEKVCLSKKIGVLLNFTPEQVSAVCDKRKPSIQINDNQFKIGRFSLNINKKDNYQECKSVFAFNLQSLVLLEQIAAAVCNSESVLLVGETGNGKTSTIQYLASKLKKNLVIINLNQQTDSTDIIGGYKPIAFNFVAKKLKTQFEDLFNQTYSVDQNISFLNNLLSLYDNKKWKSFLTVLDHITTKTLAKNKLSSSLNKKWSYFKKKIINLKNKEFDKFLAFEFIEGKLIQAIEKGEWVLLDEINLAEAETLQFLTNIIDEKNESFSILDKNDGNLVKRHKEFRLFSCMNPSTDVGKKELPIGVRNLFTEIFVEELESETDLQILTQAYIGNLVNSNQVEKIVKLYLQLKKESRQSLNGYNTGPYYSLRTFCRALKVSSSNLCKNIKKTLYEAFCLSFLTQLDQKSHDLVENLIVKYLFSKEKINFSKILIPQTDENTIEIENFKGYWLPKGTKKPFLDENYILTDSVKRNLFNLIRIISIGKTFPILLQGETSVGKTSMIEWLAQATGNVCYRINNHDHIDLQEYVGNYTVDNFGKLVFKEGLLIEAMRNGYWLILDELNLASTEVLEALNRVLDDNREIFIPEIQETVQAHPQFLLFATQNPPETYGGRKILSRAFRNRFVELKFDEIPCKELEIILSRRCFLPSSYSKKMVDVFRDLRSKRKESSVFAGKSGFVTLRDLFRWGERYKEYSKTVNENFFNWENYLANEGFILIGGRVRKNDELSIVKEILEGKFKTKITDQFLTDNFKELIKSTEFNNSFKHIVWTKNSIKTCCLLFRALKYKEPVLLVGETGCGKTTFCQLYANQNDKELFTVNCHMNTESSDFIGSLRPTRSLNESESEKKLFEWVDGPLVNAMKNGSTFLVDEISLADDSVLERLNSLLEPKRTLFLAEKTISEDYSEGFIAGESDNIKIVAEEEFRFVATMNPGGDYAKKELSPALRNRFTEIWCSSDFDEEDIKKIISHNINNNISQLGSFVCDLICEFLNWFHKKIITRSNFSIRDILTLVEFVNTRTKDQPSELSLVEALYNGIELLYVDAIGSSSISSYLKPKVLKQETIGFLKKIFIRFFPGFDLNKSSSMKIEMSEKNKFGINNFCIPLGSNSIQNSNFYVMNSSSVNNNCLKILKAMQLSKSILLEGVPGVGKTSLVDALAKASGYKLIRINLSEQTDINDLFGADLPVENQEAKFEWRDGPLLQALKTESCWVLLDELNLASQSVLEGLNACLDHRGEIFIPELNRTFKLNKSLTRIFASQNPHLQGGGRKGLPKSFMNRFITLFIDSFSNDDLVFILNNVFDEIPKKIIEKMVSFNQELLSKVETCENFSSVGTPWEFNLRDMIRWCELIQKEKYIDSKRETQYNPEKFVDLIYKNRFRTIEDRESLVNVFEKHFSAKYSDLPKGFYLNKNFFQVGNSVLDRKGYKTDLQDFQLIAEQSNVFESVMKCIEMNWMSILVGSNSVGKSSIITMLSLLTGNTLNTLSVNSEMDSTELLGGFEQQDFARHFKEIEKETWNHIKLFFKKDLEFDEKISNYVLIEEILNLWFKKESIFIQTDGDEAELILKKLEYLIELLNLIGNENLSKKSSSLKALIQRTNSINGNGTFEWVDSILIESIKKGQWLLIDNANLCSASVLDRINSLLEPNGFLTINEQGSINKELPIIKPHPDFRLFLTMNPKQGELSRAMRNRGIEIYIEDKDLLSHSNFILKNFDNEQKTRHDNLINSIVSQLKELQQSGDLRQKISSKFFKFYLIHFIKNLEFNFTEEMDQEHLDYSNKLIKKYFFSIKSLKGDYEIFKYQKSLSFKESFLINSLKDNKKILYESIGYRILFETTNFLTFKLIKKSFDEKIVENYFDESLINEILNSNTIFLKDNKLVLDMFDYPIDFRNSLSFFKKKLVNTSDWKKKLNYSNLWSVKLFHHQFTQFINDLELKNEPSFCCTKNLSTSSFAGQLSLAFTNYLKNFINKFKSTKLKYNIEISNEEYIKIRSYFSYLFGLIKIGYSGFKEFDNVLFNYDNIKVLWILSLQKKIFIFLNNYFDFDIEEEKNELNKHLNIDSYINDKDYQALLKNFDFLILPKNQESAYAYNYLWNCTNEFFSKDYSFLLKNHQILKEIIKNYQSYSNGLENLEKTKTNFDFYLAKIKNPNAFEKILDEEVKGDLELKQKFDSQKLTFEANLHAIHQMLFFKMEIQAINSTENNLTENKKLILDNLLSLNNSNKLIINPFHQYLFSNYDFCVSKKFELVLHHCLDSLKLFRNDITFKLVNFHDIFNVNLLKDNLTNYETKLKNYLKVNFWLKEEFNTYTSPVFTLILMKNLLQENLRLGYLNYQQEQIKEIMKLIPINYFEFFGTFLNSEKFYKKVFLDWTSFLVSKTKGLKNFSFLSNNLIQIKEKLENDSKDKIGESNSLMCSIGITTCKIFFPNSPIDPVQRIDCKLQNYQFELNLINYELELREVYCKMIYGRNFNEQEDHPHIKKLINRKIILKNKINKLSSTISFRPTPSLFFVLKNEMSYFLEKILSNSNLEKSLLVIKNFIDNNDENLLNDEILESIQILINFKKQVYYFIDTVLLKYTQYYDLLCNFLIGVCFVYHSINLITSNASKKLSLLKLDIDKPLLEKLYLMFSYDNHDPNVTTDCLVSFLQSKNIFTLFETTRSGTQYCNTMLYKATLFEIMNAFSFETDQNKTICLMDTLINKFLETWKEQEELKRLKQEEEEALYHYKIRNENEIVNDEEQLDHDVNLNFPLYEDLYSDLIDTDEDQILKAEKFKTIEDHQVYLDSNIVLEIIDLHRKITESIYYKKPIQFNFKKSYKIRYTVLSELIESYGPMLSQLIDEIVIDGHLVVYDLLKEDVLNFQNVSENFNLYTDYSVVEIKKCFIVLEKLKEKIIANLSDQMFTGHVTLRRLLKFILRIYSIQITQPLIKFLTGLEIILKVAQDWEEISPKEFKLVNELEELKELIVNWRQIELKNYSNCLNNVFKKIRNQDFLKWWFHFYSIMSEILKKDTKNNEKELIEFYSSLASFMNQSTIGEFSNRLALIENFLLHASCLKPNHQVIIVMKNLLYYYKKIEVQIASYIENLRIDFDKQVKDKVKIINWKKVNYFGLKNLITKTHRIVMKNMNKFTRALSEKSITHFFAFNQMAEQPKISWSFKINEPNYEKNNNNLVLFDEEIIMNSEQLKNFEFYNLKTFSLIEKCLKRSNKLNNKIKELNEFSNCIIENVEELKKLSVDKKITENEKRKKAIKSITNKKDHQLTDLLKFLKNTGLSYQKGLNNIEYLKFDSFLKLKIVDKSKFLDDETNNNIDSMNSYYYKLLNKFVYFLDVSQLPSLDVNQQKLDKLKGFILHLVLKIKINRKNLSKQLTYFNQLKNFIIKIGDYENENTILTNKIREKLNFIFKSTTQLKILLIKSEDIVKILINSNNNDFVLKNYSNITTKLIEVLNEIKIPSEFPIFLYTEEELRKIINKILFVINEIDVTLSNCFIDKEQDLNTIFMKTLSFARYFKCKLIIFSDELKNTLDSSTQTSDITIKENYKTLVNETNQSIKKVLFKVQETFKFLNSEEINLIELDQEDNLLLDLEKLNIVFNALDLNSIKNNFESYLKKSQNIGINLNKNQCKLMKNLFKRTFMILKNYLNLNQYFLSLYIGKIRTLNKLDYILISLFNELNKNGFCIPPDLNENEQKQKDGQFKEVNDGGFGEGEGSEDVSKEIKNLNQVEGLEKNEDQKDEEQNEKEEIEEEDKGIDIEDDFEGQTFDKKEKSDSDLENDENDSEKEENEMGDVKDDQEILDENVWGDDDAGEEEKFEENEVDSKKGEEKNENLVAKEEEASNKNSDEKNKKNEIDFKEEFKDSEDEIDLEEKKKDVSEKDNKNSDLDKDLESIPDNLDLNTSDEENSENDDILDKDLNLDENQDEEEIQNENVDTDEEEKKKDDNDETNEMKDQENEDESEDFKDDSMKLEDEVEMKQDENVEEEMEVENNENSLNKTSDQANENFEINEDSKNKNQAVNEMNLEQNIEEKNSGLNDQQAFSYHESSNLITKENFENLDSENIKKETDIDLSNLNNNSQKKYSENINTSKRSQILDRKNEKKNFKEERQKKESNLYQHIDDNMSGDEDIIDKADDDKKSNIKQAEEEKEKQENIKKENLNDVEMLDDLKNFNELKQANKFSSNDNLENFKEDKKAEGGNINKNDKSLVSKSTFVQRPEETTFHTELEKLKIDYDKNEIDCVDKVLNKVFSKEDHHSKEFIHDSILAWRECEKVVSPLINELTAHLQLILEPTKTTKFKGDFKSGKRLNMRKIIPYIASQYRKDKIWLRRTKPSKREYQIILALDDSGSMIDNHSKKLAFESLILLGKSLNLLEVGEIGIISFGEKTKVVNDFDEPFNDTIGSKLFSEFTFKQKKTKINDLLAKVKIMMENVRFRKKNRELSQLLMVISDGRGLFNEGESSLKNKIKQIYDSGIFIVFMVLDNPENKDSILDIVVPEFTSNGEVLFKSYMEKFPFPFYIIVRSIEQLPNILGQALRQWFELVTINDK